MRKCVSVTFLIVFVITGILSLIVLGKILPLHATGFVAIGSMMKGFYICLLDAVFMLSLLGCLFMVHNLLGNGRKVLNVIFNVIKCIVAVVCLVIVGYTVLSINKYKADMTPAFVSPDGEYKIYYAGSDSDIFGNTSGYMHYAVEREKCCYDRVFYVYDEDIVPEIIWSDDGFLVTGEGVRSENGTSTTIRTEVLDDGVFVYFK